MADAGARALVTNCKNCSRTLVLMTDPTGHMKVIFEDPEVPRFIECEHCRFTYAYETSEFQWARIEQSH